MQKKEFIKPEMNKCVQPLDKVTLQLGCYRPQQPVQNGPFDPARG